MAGIATILTHPGGAHKDEFLACCVLAGLYPVPMERREPTAADLDDASVCVVDVGHRHEAETGNFDHHQFPKDHPPTCSLSLVLKHLGLYEDARMFCEWLEPAEWFDSRGPLSTAKWLGVERDVIDRLNSPIDITLLRRFSLAARLEPGEPLWEIMRMIGEDFLTHVKTLRSRIDFIGEVAEVWTVDLAGSPARILYVPRTEPLPEEPSLGLERYLDSRGLAGEVIGMIYPDRRGAGYGLSRLNDNPRLDFTRISDEADVHFAHARGFVAKTSATDRERLITLVNLAGVPASQS